MELDYVAAHEFLKTLPASLKEPLRVCLFCHQPICPHCHEATHADEHLEEKVPVALCGACGAKLQRRAQGELKTNNKAVLGAKRVTSRISSARGSTT
jgi:hypothetical protein